MEDCVISIQTLLQDFDYEASIYPFQVEPVENAFDSCIQVFAALFCLSFECPVLIRKADLQNVRDLLVYWI